MSVFSCAYAYAYVAAVFTCLHILGDPGAVNRVGRKGGTKVFKYGQNNPGYQLSPNYFQKFKQMPAPDWAQKMLCIIVPNRRIVSPDVKK